MAKENELEKVKEAIEEDVAQLEKSLESSTCPVGEFITQEDEDEKTDVLKPVLGETLFNRLVKEANKLGTTPIDLAKTAIVEYIDSIEKEKKSK